MQNYFCILSKKRKWKQFYKNCVFYFAKWEIYLLMKELGYAAWSYVALISWDLSADMKRISYLSIPLTSYEFVMLCFQFALKVWIAVDRFSCVFYIASVEIFIITELQILVNLLYIKKF